MKALLDTHTLLWAVINPAPLSRVALKAINDKTSTLLVSAASAWEIATKVRSGRLPGAEAFESNFLTAIDEMGYTLLSIDAETALRALDSSAITAIHSTA